MLYAASVPMQLPLPPASPPPPALPLKRALIGPPGAERLVRPRLAVPRSRPPSPPELLSLPGVSALLPPGRERDRERERELRRRVPEPLLSPPWRDERSPSPRAVYRHLAGPPPSAPYPAAPIHPTYPYEALTGYGPRSPEPALAVLRPPPVATPVGGLPPRAALLGPSPTGHHGPQGPVPGTGKPSRYLREMDRRAILARIDRGEKQSALAKEFQVSRAAICNLYKHRDEVMSRKDGNPLAKHPKKPRPKAAASGSNSSSAASARTRTASTANQSSAAGRDNKPPSAIAKAHGVHELRSRAAALLLTRIRAAAAGDAQLRRCGSRLARLVLEEALALAPLRPVPVALAGGARAEGVELEHESCAVTLEPRGRELLRALFARMEPERSTARAIPLDGGAIALADGPTALPATLRGLHVLVLEPVAQSPARICAALRAVVARGADERLVTLAALLVTRDVAAAVRREFPGARVVAAQVEADADVDDPAEEAVDGLRRRLEAVFGVDGPI